MRSFSICVHCCIIRVTPIAGVKPPSSLSGPAKSLHLKQQSHKLQPLSALSYLTATQFTVKPAFYFANMPTAASTSYWLQGNFFAFHLQSFTRPHELAIAVEPLKVRNDLRVRQVSIEGHLAGCPITKRMQQLHGGIALLTQSYAPRASGIHFLLYTDTVAAISSEFWV